MRRVLYCKQKTAYEMRSSDWSSDVCSSDLAAEMLLPPGRLPLGVQVDKRDKRDESESCLKPAWEMTMPTAIEFIADRLPRVTVEDVRRFADTVEIRDASAFAAELQAFIHERVEAVTLPANLEEIGRASCRERVCQYV